MDLIKRIHELYNEMSHTQKLVADYILAHQDEIAFYTLEELAKKARVSTTTIIRLAKALGYSGYSDMQKVIQRSISKRENITVRLRDMQKFLPSETEDLLSICCNYELQNIKGTFENLNKKDVEKAIDLIYRADKIFISGFREAFALAYNTRITLSQIRKNVTIISGIGHTCPEEAAEIQAGNLCIVFTFPRYSEATLDLLHWMKEQKANIIIITSYKHFGLENYANIILPCFTDSVSFKHSLAAPIFLVNYLVAEVVNKNIEAASKHGERIEKLIKIH